MTNNGTQAIKPLGARSQNKSSMSTSHLRPFDFYNKGNATRPGTQSSQQLCVDLQSAETVPATSAISNTMSSSQACLPVSNESYKKQVNSSSKKNKTCEANWSATKPLSDMEKIRLGDKI